MEVIPTKFIKRDQNKMGILYGTYHLTLDSKRRIVLPAKLYYAQPDGLRDKLYLTRGIDKCITGYNWEQWNTRLTNFNKLKINEKNKDKLNRLFFSSADEGELDKQRRMVVPEHLVAYAGLQEDGEIVIAGCGNKIEIWNPALFEIEKTESEEIYQEVMSQITLEGDNFLSPLSN
jgi:MraZ protein